MRILVVITAAVFMVGCRADERPADARTVPCELLKTRHLALSVMIDGKGPFRLIFDTGSPVVLLNSRVAKECRLMEPGRKAPKPPGPVWPGQVILKSIEASGVKAEAVPAVVVDHPTVKAIEGMTGPIDGILGYPFFARYTTTVDYAQPAIRFEPNAHIPTDAMTGMMTAMVDRSRAKGARTIDPAGTWGVEVEKPAGDDSPGVLVRRVFEATPAAAAGITPGDRLLSIDGRWTDSVEDCFRAAAAAPAGRRVTAVLRRGDRPLALAVTPVAGF